MIRTLLAIVAITVSAPAVAQEAPGYSDGPFNLILRWGNGSPIAIRYESRKRCEMAGVMAITQGDTTVGERGKPDIPPDPSVAGANRPAAFCIPA